MGDNIISTRTKFDKFIDKDEIGGPNDHYQNLSYKLANLASIWYIFFCLLRHWLLNISFLSIDYIIDDMSTVLLNYFKLLLTREW